MRRARVSITMNWFCFYYYGSVEPPLRFDA